MNEHGAVGAGSSGDSVFSGFGSCGSSSSDLNTPAVSEMDSTESDEDNFIAELTRQMAENMLQEDDDKASPPNSSVSENTEKLLSSGGSSNFCSEITTSVLPNPTTQIYSNQVGFADQSYHHQKKTHPHQPQNREYSHGRRAGFLSALQAGSGMRVVFLGGSGSRSASSGTGVFLPNATNNPPQYQTRKKPVCSTVLMPERVLQALKLHFEKRDAIRHSNGGLHAHAQRNQRSLPHKLPETIRNNEELQLPQEWTY